jgi:hypothetical protein
VAVIDLARRVGQRQPAVLRLEALAIAKRQRWRRWGQNAARVFSTWPPLRVDHGASRRDPLQYASDVRARGVLLLGQVASNSNI